MNQKMNRPDFYPTQHTLIGWFPSHIHHQIAFCSLQAQLLKDCGTTPATPLNLGKHLKTWKLLNVENNLHLPMFHLDEKTPEAYGEEVSEQTPSSCITYSQNSAKISTGYSHAGEES
ncbi:unnamed protein product [Brassica napus]|uniref:(rape) hypothetical protein n=1 Tax=Brassica napus TaxID=3708 RepID=A0A816WWJ3_BRANA|nr:unnamed protein product [Brassica napus]